MIAYFPIIYPDELVYSWFCRYYVHAGHISHQAALKELYCNKSDTLSKEFIGNLKQETRTFISAIMPIGKLISDHTMFPQYARFIPSEQKRQVFAEIETGVCNVQHALSIQPRVEAEQYMRYCLACAQEDRKLYGETYWHRKHQIRNIDVCTKHMCKLKHTGIPVKSERSYTFCPAEHTIPHDESTEPADPLAIQFAKYVVDIFDAADHFEKDVPISLVLNDGLRGTKYISKSGQCRNVKKLTDDMLGFYQGRNLHEAATINQVQRTLLGNRFDFSTVCQIAYFLGISTEKLISPNPGDSQIRRKDVSGKNSIPVNWEELDAENALKFEAIARGIYDGTLNENGRPERVSERTMYRQMNLRAHQLENMPLCRKILEQYTEPYPESWARKIVWAYQKLKDTGVSFFWADIRELSGVKRKNLGKIAPFLGKHANETDLGKILKICRMDDFL